MGGLCKMAADPVCKMDVNEKESKLVVNIKVKNIISAPQDVKKHSKTNPNNM
jgi:YHS domain-containing protein